MFRNISTSSRMIRLGVLGLATMVAAVAFTTDTADARRRYKKVRHHHARAAYAPAFASIIVDANSGATLTSSHADSPRHPASLTKIMTLYMLFERLESGKLKLDSELEVSEHASEQAPTKLGLRPGQTIRVEDAIKGLVTRSANDAAAVVAEAIAGDEEDFAKLMTRKARALGMSRTVYKNASGLPDSDQITTARDQATLGRAIQDRFPRYYRYFATNAFHYRGRVIRSHNRLLGSVEGVDGIKTGYTRASGFNLVTSIKRGNRHLVGVVLGGRSGGSRDAIMRNLLAEHIDDASTRRTVAAITERDTSDATVEVAEARPARAAPAPMIQVQGALRPASAAPEPVPPPAPRAPFAAAATPVAVTAVPSTVQARSTPLPLTNGVVSSQPLAPIPGSAEPMTPVRVKTVQVRAGGIKLASAGPAQPAPASTAAISSRASDTAETSISVVAKAEMPVQPANHGTGQGILGVLPASSHSQVMAYADTAPRVSPAQTQTVQHNGAIKAVVRSGWIIQVGALESESEAKARLDAARGQARNLLGKADPFTETVAKGDKTLYRARFAGLDKDQAEAACRTLKRSEISCIAIKN